MTTFFRDHAPVCRAIICTILATFAVACTSMRTVPVTDGETLSSQISVGEKIEVTQHNGDIANFTLHEITESGIGGDEYFIRFDDIEQIRVAQSSRSVEDLENVETVVLGVMLGVLMFAFAY